MTDIEVKYPGINPVFFIGASLGGVDALAYLAEQLPEDFPAALFFLLHRTRTGKHLKNTMLDILTSRSKLRVVIPKHGDTVKAGYIYLPADGLHLGVDDNRITLTTEPDNEIWRPSIDVLFKSGARDYKDRCVSVLLTGKLDDGVDGLVETTYQGGITVAQSPNDAYDPHLPLNALMNDHPVYVLPLSEMPELFCELAQHQFTDNQKKITAKAAVTAKFIREAIQ